jgi:hypothetical protein
MPKTVDYFTHPEKGQYASVEPSIPRTSISRENLDSATAHFSIPKPVPQSQESIADECSEAIAALTLLENERHFNQYADFNQHASNEAKSSFNNSQGEFLAGKLRGELSKIQHEVDTRNYDWVARPWRQAESIFWNN